MTRRKKDPLRPMTEEERIWLERISRSQSEPSVHVIRAKEILAVAAGRNYTEAARLAGIKSGDTVSKLVERERVLAEARRQTDPEKDGTNTWSLTTLQKALQKAPDGLPTISTERIWVILQEAGFRWQKSRSWCETGQVARKRKHGVVTVVDSDATPKKN